MQRLASIVFFLALLLAAPLAANSEHIDYDLLNHDIAMATLRAGNHDARGHNQYYFKVTLFALQNTPEERELPLSERRQRQRHLGSFGDFEVENLRFWRGDVSEEDLRLSVTGDQLRGMTWHAMRELELREDEISLYVQIEMFEREKRFFFFGQDRLIGTTGYYPLPPTSFDPPARSPRTLKISDDHGADVTIAVTWEHSQ